MISLLLNRNEELLDSVILWNNIKEVPVYGGLLIIGIVRANASLDVIR
jgi:hypothetical protein